MYIYVKQRDEYICNIGTKFILNHYQQLPPQTATTIVIIIVIINNNIISISINTITIIIIIYLFIHIKPNRDDIKIVVFLQLLRFVVDLNHIVSPHF